MIENLLVDDLIAYLESYFKENLLPSEQGDYVPPKIVSGWLPHKRSSGPEDRDFPFIIVRPRKGATTDQSNSSASIELLIGAYSEEYDGYQHNMQILARLRQALFGLPALTLNSRYRLEFPLNWELFEDQPWPEWAMKVVTNWTVYTPQPADEFEGEFF